MKVLNVFLCSTVALLIVFGVPFSSDSTLILDLNIEEPIGSFLPTENIGVTASLSNLPGSTESLMFNGIGRAIGGSLFPFLTISTFSSGGILSTYEVFDWGPSIDEAVEDFYLQLANLTLTPGDAFDIFIGTYVAPVGGVDPGTYGPDQLGMSLGLGDSIHDSISVTVASAPITEPATMLLLGSGLLGLIGFRKKFRK